MYDSLNGGLPCIDAMFPLDAIICIYTIHNIVQTPHVQCTLYTAGYDRQTQTSACGPGRAELIKAKFKAKFKIVSYLSSPNRRI